MVESGAARYFVPSKQIPEGGLNRDAGLGSKQESFSIKQERTGGGKLTVASVGQFAEVEPVR